jgi:hypothetical protein
LLVDKASSGVFVKLDAAASVCMSVKLNAAAWDNDLPGKLPALPPPSTQDPSPVIAVT